MFRVTEPFADGDAVNNAFYHISGNRGGAVVQDRLSHSITALIALFANVLVSHATTSKMLFAMARDGEVPDVWQSWSQKHQVPATAMIVVTILTAVIGVLAVGQIELIVTMVTFGALTAYILLHISVIIHFGIRQSSKKYFIHWISPVLGIAVLGYALYSTNVLAKVHWHLLATHRNDRRAHPRKRTGRTLETEDGL